MSALQVGTAAAAIAASSTNEITGPNVKGSFVAIPNTKPSAMWPSVTVGGDPEHDSNGYQRKGPAHEHSEDVPSRRPQSRSNAYLGSAHLDQLGNDPVETNHGQEQGETGERDK